MKVELSLRAIAVGVILAVSSGFAGTTNAKKSVRKREEKAATKRQMICVGEGETESHL